MNQQTHNTHVARVGLSIPLPGSPKPAVETGPVVQTAALVASDYVGLRPKFHVQVGEVVARGQLLFEDRKIEGVRFVSPVAGRVKAVHRGEKRAFESLVLELDEEELASGSVAHAAISSLSGKQPSRLTGDEVRQILIESGLWTALRARPFGKVPSPLGPKPRSIFVTAMSTDPLAPDFALLLAGRQQALEAGLTALVRLAGEGKVHLCRAPGAGLPGEDVRGVVVHEFHGPHPSGTPGFHIHTIDPVGPGRMVYHLSAQDAADIGDLLLNGKLPATRIVALGGPGLKHPRHVRTVPGASLDELLRGELASGPQRVLSGSVLSGREAQGAVQGYLGRYHHQITALSDSAPRRFLGWLEPGRRRFSTTRMFLSALLRPKSFEFSTELHGGLRALVPTGAYERVMPFEMMPTFLLRAILAGDVETAGELGVLELVEEDLALCTLVCPSKIEYSRPLREMLVRIEKEG